MSSAALPQSPDPLLPDPDTLAPDQLRDALREAHRMLAERQGHLDLIEQLAGIGSREIDLERDAIRWSRERKVRSARSTAVSRGVQPLRLAR